MKIISWNVNGLRAVHNKGLFLPFIAQHQPDILCLQEIKSRKEQNKLDLSEYIEYWNPADKPGYSGTAIFTKTAPLSVMFGMPAEIAEKYDLKNDQYGDLTTEGRVTTAEFADFYVVTVYTPNSKDDLSRLSLRYDKWDRAFLEYVSGLQKKKPVIFCGDLNVAHTEDDLANSKPNVGKHGFTNEEREGIDNVIKAGFVDTFRHFTSGNGHYSWWTHWAKARERNVGWRIDYFFISQSLLPRLKSATILSDVFGSDHCPVEVVVDIK
jgi:exodeoxyribonuclease-3